uniref:Uncharacterized protein n=1 Tax=Triticum urartu TaxID=4572 RepID=A0A8R7UUN4_TRIUA
MILLSKTPSGAPPVSRADLQNRRSCPKLKFSYKVVVPGSDRDWIYHHLPRCT